MKKLSGKLLVQQDLQELVKRLNSRMEDGLRIFAQKRSREHFNQIFFNRYKEFSPDLLRDLSKESYSLVVGIYEEIDNLYWYLNSTEDMPSLVNTKVAAYLKNMNASYGKVIDLLISDELLDNEEDLVDHQAIPSGGETFLDENKKVESSLGGQAEEELKDILGDDLEYLSDNDLSEEDLAFNDEIFESTNTETPPPFFEDGEEK